MMFHHLFILLDSLVRDLVVDDKDKMNWWIGSFEALKLKGIIVKEFFPLESFIFLMLSKNLNLET